MSDLECPQDQFEREIERVKETKTVDAVRAALPESIQTCCAAASFEEVDPNVVYAIGALMIMEKKDGKPWSGSAGKSEAQAFIRRASKMLKDYTKGLTVDAHEVLLVEQKEINADQKEVNADQKEINKEQIITNKFVQKDLDASAQDKNDIKKKLNEQEGAVRELKGEHGFAERLLTDLRGEREEEMHQILNVNRDLRKKCEGLAAVEAKLETERGICNGVVIERNKTGMCCVALRST